MHVTLHILLHKIRFPDAPNPTYTALWNMHETLHILLHEICMKPYIYCFMKYAWIPTYTASWNMHETLHILLHEICTKPYIYCFMKYTWIPTYTASWNIHESLHILLHEIYMNPYIYCFMKYTWIPTYTASWNIHETLHIPLYEICMKPYIYCGMKNVFLHRDSLLLTACMKPCFSLQLVSCYVNPSSFYAWFRIFSRSARSYLFRYTKATAWCVKPNHFLWPNIFLHFLLCETLLGPAKRFLTYPCCI